MKEALLIDNDSKQIIFTTDLKEDNNEFWNENSDFVPLLGYNEWDGHIYISGATNAGKSYFIKKIIQNDKKKRPVILFTDLENKDPSLEDINYVKFDEKNPEADSNWLKDHQENCIMVFDDVQFNEDLLQYRDKMIEKGRHKGVVVICVNHKTRGWAKTMVPLNDCKWIICFPNSNRGSCFNYLKDELHINNKKNEAILDQISKEGRQMIIHKFSPNFVAGSRSIIKV